MIIILNENTSQIEIEMLGRWLEDKNLRLSLVDGFEKKVYAIIGDTAQLDIDKVCSFQFVREAKWVIEPHKKVDKISVDNHTVIELENGTKIGGDNFVMMVGPCTVESIDQLSSVAEFVKSKGASVIRGGAYKPRTSPYSFQGLGKEGIDLMLQVKKETKLPIISELLDVRDIDNFSDVDIIQIGARNMQNTPLLKEVAKSGKTVLLKRGWSNTIEELLLSAEYVLSGGNSNVILCERGIRTFENSLRNTLDISAIPILKEKTHLPVMVDPSHAVGKSKHVSSMALASVAAGADGLIIEVHDEPQNALCDGPQALTFEEFDDLSKKITILRNALKLNKNL